ncbi:hypothetical protein H2203_008112 [Taxawa tesnikishii (nom. ined.)]|nr:hypothetical protein H2203_008112 [Dothideales sp. JES 119]
MATNKSAIDPSIPPLKPHYEPPSTAPDPSNPPKEPPHLASLIKTLSLQPHIEGGYFVETDRDAWRIPSPFPKQEENTTTFYTATGAVGADLSNKLSSADKANPSTEVQKSGDVVNKDDGRQGEKGDTRNASTTIHYLLTPSSPLGAFHRNRGRTVHTLHKGRGRYVIVHADEVMGTVVPGFEFEDHDFMRPERLEALVTKEQADEMRWMLRKGPQDSDRML